MLILNTNASSKRHQNVKEPCTVRLVISCIIIIMILIIILSVFRVDMTVICLLLLNIVIAAPSISFYAKVLGGVETIRTIFLFSICFQ